MKPIIAFLSSLKLTIWCLLAAMILILYATIWQPTLGIHESSERFFFSFFIYWSPPDSSIAIPYFLGGYSIGFFLLLNIATRYLSPTALKIKNVGIALAHCGIAILIISQFASRILETSSLITVREGHSSTYSEDTSESELAIIEHSYSKTEDRVFAAPDKMLTYGHVIRDQRLPFIATANFFYPNSKLHPRNNDYTSDDILATEGLGKELQAIPIPPDRSPNPQNRPATLVTLFADKEVIGTWLLQVGLAPQIFTFENAEYTLQLRPKRHYHPFALKLDKIVKRRYQDTAINQERFANVSLLSSKETAPRQTSIDAANPLRIGNTSIHQYEDSLESRSAIFKVVDNPARQLPFFALYLILAGLVIHFGRALFAFLSSEREAR